MKSGEKDYSVKEAMIFSQRIAQLSKALWKCVEKDWQMWIKPYDLNINEHHILTIAYHLKGLLFLRLLSLELCTYQRRLTSRKAGRTRLSCILEKEDDKRNTYIEITDKGEELLLRLMEEYDPENNSVFNGALALRNFMEVPRKYRTDCYLA